MDLGIKGKTALVTGSDRNTGQIIASALLEAGAQRILFRSHRACRPREREQKRRNPKAQRPCAPHRRTSASRFASSSPRATSPPFTSGGSGGEGGEGIGVAVAAEDPGAGA